MSRIIYVSCTHLLEMDSVDIRHTVIHELTHIFDQTHDGSFHTKCQDIRSSNWRPESTSGIIMINGGKRTSLEKKDNTYEEPEIDNTHCNHHLCNNHETNLLKCEYCGGFYCIDHIAPIPPSMPKFNIPKKFIEWKDNENTHACPEYYDYLQGKIKEEHRRYQHSLDRMNLISKSENIYHQDFEFEEDFLNDKSNIKTNRFDSISKKIDNIINKFKK